MSFLFCCPSICAPRRAWNICKLTPLCRLMREASIKSRKSGEKNISANTVRKVTEVCDRIDEIWDGSRQLLEYTTNQPWYSFRKHCASSRDRRYPSGSVDFATSGNGLSHWDLTGLLGYCDLDTDGVLALGIWYPARLEISIEVMVTFDRIGALSHMERKEECWFARECLKWLHTPTKGFGPACWFFLL